MSHPTAFPFSACVTLSLVTLLGRAVADVSTSGEFVKALGRGWFCYRHRHLQLVVHLPEEAVHEIKLDLCVKFW